MTYCGKCRAQSADPSLHGRVEMQLALSNLPTVHSRTLPGQLHETCAYNLSKYSPSFGISTLRFFRLRTARINSCILLPSCKQSPCKFSQWSKTHCGKAWPEVACRKAATKPKDSATGKWAFTCTNGVPSRGFSSKTQPRRKFMQLYTPLIASCGHVISTKKTGSCKVGLAVSSAAKQQRRVGGMICPAPR